MNLFKNYIKYLKDNPEGYWFKRKLYGWGWVPARWQGWFVILIFILLLLLNSLSVAFEPTPTDAELIWFFSRTVLYVILIIFIGYKKGEKPRWQWGLKNKDLEI